MASFLVFGRAGHHLYFLFAVGVLGVLFFDGGSIFMFYRLFIPKVIFVVGRKGFTDHSSLAAIDFIAWDEVVGIKPYILGSQQLIGGM